MTVLAQDGTLFFGVNRTRDFTVFTKADERRTGLCDWLKNDPHFCRAASSRSIKIKAQVGLKVNNFDQIAFRLISEQSCFVLLFILDGGVDLLRLTGLVPLLFFLWNVISHLMFHKYVCKRHHSSTFLAVNSEPVSFWARSWRSESPCQACFSAY